MSVEALPDSATESRWHCSACGEECPPVITWCSNWSEGRREAHAIEVRRVVVGDETTEFRVLVDGHAPGGTRYSEMETANRHARDVSADRGVRAVVECRDVSAWREVYVSNPVPCDAS